MQGQLVAGFKYAAHGADTKEVREYNTCLADAMMSVHVIYGAHCHLECADTEHAWHA